MKIFLDFPPILDLKILKTLETSCVCGCVSCVG